MSNKYPALFIVAVNVAIVAFLFDNKNAILFSLLFPVFFWLASLVGLLTESEYFDPLMLDGTSVVSIVGFGMYVYQLTEDTMKYWFLGWYCFFVLIFTNSVFKFRYYSGNELVFFVFEFFLLGIASYLLTFTGYVPWGVIWIFFLPIPLFVMLMIYENFAPSNSKQYVLLKALLGTLAILSIGYIGMFADISPPFSCVQDSACNHGSSLHGTGENADEKGLCKCLDSSWVKTSFDRICLPCPVRGIAKDCCGNFLSQDNVKTLSCDNTESSTAFKCVDSL